jgi:hypothetical protein
MIPTRQWKDGQTRESGPSGHHLVSTAECVMVALDDEHRKRRQLGDPGLLWTARGMKRKRQGHDRESPNRPRSATGDPGTSAPPTDDQGQRTVGKDWHRVAPCCVEVSGRAGNPASSHSPWLFEPPNTKSSLGHGPGHHVEVGRGNSPTCAMT